MTIPPSRPMRRDAQQRREALLDAASACFAERGFSVSLEEIAARAGVGRGTLYRNFRDRMALALAIFAREVERIGERFEADRPVVATLADMVRRGRGASRLFARLSAEMPPDEEDKRAFEALGARLQRLMEPVAARGRASGELRADVTPADLVLAMRMVGGLLLSLREEDAKVESVIDEALALLVVGLGR